jgi:hypothetical protein
MLWRNQWSPHWTANIWNSSTCRRFSRRNCRPTDDSSRSISSSLCTHSQSSMKKRLYRCLEGSSAPTRAHFHSCTEIPGSVSKWNWWSCRSNCSYSGNSYQPTCLPSHDSQYWLMSSAPVLELAPWRASLDSILYIFVTSIIITCDVLWPMYHLPARL